MNLIIFLKLKLETILIIEYISGRSKRYLVSVVGSNPLRGNGKPIML